MKRVIPIESNFIIIQIIISEIIITWRSFFLNYKKKSQDTRVMFLFLSRTNYLSRTITIILYAKACPFWYICSPLGFEFFFLGSKYRSNLWVAQLFLNLWYSPFNFLCLVRQELVVCRPIVWNWSVSRLMGNSMASLQTSNCYNGRFLQNTHFLTTSLW